MREAGANGLLMFTTHAFRAAIFLAASGGACRFLLRHVETRWQIIGFWFVILIYQLALRPRWGRPISLASILLDLTCVTVAIIAVKFAIEGKLTH